MKHDIEPIINEYLSCHQGLLATYASYQKREYDMIFAESWGFKYRKEDQPFGMSLDPDYQNRRELLLEKFHGIKVIDELYNDKNDLINLIQSKLPQSPVILHCDVFDCPWNISYQRNHIDHLSSIDLNEKTAKLCKNNSLSIYTVFLTCLKILFLKCTSQKKINIISPVYNELNGSKKVSVMLEDILNPESSFKETLYNVKKTIIEKYSGQTKYKENTQDNISSKIMFSYNELHDAACVEFIKQNNNLDLIFSILKYDDQINISVEYAPYYNAHTIEAITTCLVFILKQAIEAPDTLLRELKLVENDGEIVKRFDFTNITFPINQTINGKFEKIVKEAPQAYALYVNGVNYTYHQVNTRANQIAHYIIKTGIEKTSIIAILAEPTFDTIVGILGILKAGCIYLPINPDYPEERIS